MIELWNISVDIVDAMTIASTAISSCLLDAIASAHDRHSLTGMTGILYLDERKVGEGNMDALNTVNNQQ